MKKKIKYRNFLLLFLTVPFLFTMPCSDKPDNGKTLLSPSITSLSPDAGTAETEVTIVGESFGNNSSGVKVSFGSRNAKIISFSENHIKVEAPLGDSNPRVNVAVTVGNRVSNTMVFYYTDATPSSITAITPTCFYNSTVVITGNNFSPNKEDNIVKFGTTKGAVTEATSTSLTVTTPNLGNTTTTDVTVTKFDMTSNAKRIAVDADQNKIAIYNWTTHTVKPGVIYKTGQFNLFDTAQRRIYILDVTLDASNTLGVGFSTANANSVVMCNNYNAVAGVNAGYFPMSGATDKDPYIRINGFTVQTGHLGVNQIFTNSALIIHNNVATVRKFTESHNNLNQVAALIPATLAENIVVCGPILITSGEIESQNMNSSHNTSQAARTGLGVTADGKRVFMVVVDTGGGFTGVTTPQLAKILQALGATNAMNLDGGGSSTMYVKDQGANGRVNFPNGGATQRAVRSIIYVK